MTFEYVRLSDHAIRQVCQPSLCLFSHIKGEKILRQTTLSDTIVDCQLVEMHFVCLFSLRL